MGNENNNDNDILGLKKAKVIKLYDKASDEGLRQLFKF